MSISKSGMKMNIQQLYNVSIIAYRDVSDHKEFGSFLIDVVGYLLGNMENTQHKAVNDILDNVYKNIHNHLLLHGINNVSEEVLGFVTLTKLWIYKPCDVVPKKFLHNVNPAEFVYRWKCYDIINKERVHQSSYRKQYTMKIASEYNDGISELVNLINLENENAQSI